MCQKFWKRRYNVKSLTYLSFSCEDEDIVKTKTFPPETLKYWVGVQRASLTTWGEGASLPLVGHPSSDGVTIKMPYGVDVLQ